MILAGKTKNFRDFLHGKHGVQQQGAGLFHLFPQTVFVGGNLIFLSEKTDQMFFRVRCGGCVSGEGKRLAESALQQGVQFPHIRVAAVCSAPDMGGEFGDELMKLYSILFLTPRSASLIDPVFEPVFQRAAGPDMIDFPQSVNPEQFLHEVAVDDDE